jgi:hypothetical protein
MARKPKPTLEAKPEPEQGPEPPSQSPVPEQGPEPPSESPVPPPLKPVSMSEFFAAAIGEPAGEKLPHPAEELAAAIDRRTFELFEVYDYLNQPGAVYWHELPALLSGRQRLRDAVRHFHDQLFEQQAKIQQLQATRKRPPDLETLLAPDINRALREGAKVGQKEIDGFWKVLTKIRAKPTDSLEAKRQRRSRHSKA